MKRSSLLFTAALVACALPDVPLGELATTGEGTSAGDSSAGDGHEGGSGGDDATTGVIDCNGGGPWPCESDYDGDNVALPCDNAPDRFNPSQADADADGVADEADLCPMVAGSLNTDDSDDDGIGNQCDTCRQRPEVYNAAAIAHHNLLESYYVRNIPDVGDVDHDGIGDACDNCVAVANCGGFDANNPWQLGDPTDVELGPSCQLDADEDMVGDACQGMQLPGAAAPIGLAPSDDFDQDGLTNDVDGCTRLPLVEQISCDDDSACPTGASCETELGVCNHVDSDADTVGDACDTCAFAPNAQQLESGGSSTDDPDSDFIGDACEAGCGFFTDPRPMAFYSRAASGQCCSTQLVVEDGAVLTAYGAPLTRPDGVPVRLVCSAEQELAGECIQLPDAVAQAPGMLELPVGCDGIAGEPLFEADVDTLWAARCELPPLDQDYDGIGDACDLCPWSFDADNVTYIDDSGMVWPQFGKYCNGEYSIENVCGQD